MEFKRVSSGYEKKNKDMGIGMGMGMSMSIGLNGPKSTLYPTHVFMC